MPIAIAIASAVRFGASARFVKLLLAGLLYLGTGLGLAVTALARGAGSGNPCRGSR